MLIYSRYAFVAMSLSLVEQSEYSGDFKPLLTASFFWKTTLLFYMLGSEVFLKISWLFPPPFPVVLCY